MVGLWLSHGRVQAQWLATAESDQLEVVPTQGDEVPLPQALSELEKAHSVSFTYLETQVAQRTIERRLLTMQPTHLEAVLQRTLSLHGLTYEQVNPRQFLIYPLRDQTPQGLPSSKSLRVSPMGMPPQRQPLIDQPSSSRPSPTTAVQGRVIDAETGEPIAGATIRVKGETQGTFTDAQGAFTLELASAEAVLICSFVGYESQELQVTNGQTELVMKLTNKNTLLDEVVVMGFSTQRKSDLTGAVVKVKTEDIPPIAVVNAAEALRGRAAGVFVNVNSGLPGKVPTIRIRGESSINASNDPLVVIDGAPVSSSVLSTINYNDVESFEILKDAAATSIFGKQGANGVILITTKRGKEGRSSIDFNTKFGFRYFPKPLEVLDGPQFYDYLKEVLPNTPVSFGDAYFANYEDLSLSTIDTNSLYNINWQDALFDVGQFEEYNLAFASGSEKLNYRLSGSYLRDQGIIQPAQYKRYNLLFNVDAKPMTRLRIYTSLNYALTNQQGVQDGGLGWNGGVVNATLQYPPFLPVRDEVTDYFFPNPLRPNIDSPVALAEGQRNNNTAHNLNGYFKASFELIEGLRLRSEWFGQVGFSRGRSFEDRTSTYVGRIQGGTGRESINLSRGANIQHFLEYSRTFGEHNLHILAGHTAQYFINEGTSVSVFGYTNNNVNLLRDGIIPNNPSDYYSPGASFAGVSRVDYSYNNRYLVQLNFRADGSDNFAPGNRWGYFPSASVGWKLSEEAFMKGNPTIDLLKLRASAGSTGNDDIGLAYLAIYGRNDRARYPIFGDEEGIFRAIPNFPNPNIRWESTFEYNIGVDFIAWKGRLEANFDVYQRNSFDLLYNQPLPWGTGAASVPANLGQVRNQGVELFLSGLVVRRPQVSWRVNANVAYNYNQVRDLGEGTEEDRIGANWVVAGGPLNGIYGYQVDRLFQADDFDENGDLNENLPNQPGAAPGDIKYINVQDLEDANGDGIADPSAITPQDDRVFLGYAAPPLTYGLTNTVTFRGFTLSVFLQGVYGNVIYNQTRSLSEGMNDFFNQSVTVLDRWTPENTDTDMPRATIIDPNGNVNRISDRWVEDGSYLRVKDLTLSYDLPASVSGKLGMRVARVFASGQNWLTWTNYSGYDPEVGSTDNGTYPQVRSVIFGVTLGL
jgi:TonB-linked SusC/RagA family outer membrane protein